MRHFTSRKLMIAVAFFVLAGGSSLYAQSVTPFTSGGAISDQFQPQMPDLSTKGTTINSGTLTFAGAANVPATATVTSVSWTWAFTSGTYPTGLIVSLCNDSATQGYCLDISNTPHGSTQIFSGDNFTGGPKWHISMKLPGSGAVTPILHADPSDQVNINYQY